MKPRWSAKFAESRWDSRVLFEIADFGFVIQKKSVPSAESALHLGFIVQLWSAEARFSSCWMDVARHMRCGARFIFQAH